MKNRLPAHPAHPACEPAPDQASKAVAELRKTPALVLSLRDHGKRFVERGILCAVCRADLTVPVVLVVRGRLG